MNFFTKPLAAVAEVAPVLSPPEQLAAVDRECAEAEERFNLAIARERAHKIEAEKYAQEVRRTTMRRNAAWEKRANLRIKFGVSK